MEERVRASGLVPASAEVVDLGLGPDDVESIPSLRANHPGRSVRRIPVDGLLPATLSTGVGMAFVGSEPFGVLIERARTQPDGGSANADFG